ncbi:hypothetical protein KFK09_003366 [Dendrobium nobile]|uniref:Uncharacterized protein n=1 Tax=Dendrobium nobile TaxID=94219 RepID=A0A8T3BXE9_DENNO|nr:hypothetical protein KFK09_003366 [Dendrobium nobile]
MNHPFPLLLKLGAVVVAGTAALLSFRRHYGFAALHSLRRNILRTLLNLPDGATVPPTILVLGFRGHGKSAFVNTVCRVLVGEEGPMILRSETAPVGLPPTASAQLAVRVAAVVGCDCGEWVEEMEEEVEGEGLVLEFIDAPPLPEPAVLTSALVEAALDSFAVRGGGSVAPLPPECVVVVLKCSRWVRERHLAIRRLTEIAGVVRNRGLSPLIVLTHKKSLRNCKQEELKHEVAFRARTDCVYFIENYTTKCSTKCRGPTVVKNDFDTHYTALAIIRQCIEFIAQHRRQSSRKRVNLATHVNENK